MKYKGLEVKEHQSLCLSQGKFSNGTIFVKPNLDKKDLQKVLEHEYQHYLFLSKHRFLKYFLNDTATTICLICFAFAYIFFKTSFAFLFLLPHAIGITHEIQVYVKTKDYFYGFVKITILISLLFALVFFTVSI
jgi:hypothetical protein